jgi:hypothetical protein
VAAEHTPAGTCVSIGLLRTTGRNTV